MTGNANWRSLTCLLLCFDCVEIASVDSNRPSTILRRFLQPAYFFQIRRNCIIFIISGELPMYIDSRGALTDAWIVPRIVPSNGLEDLASFLAAHSIISRYPLIALCRLNSNSLTRSNYSRSSSHPPTSPASPPVAHIAGSLFR
jgi:hypothetical protein